MVVNLLHTGDVLRADNGGLPAALLGNDTAQMDDTVAHDDAEAERGSVTCLRLDYASTSGNSDCATA